MRTAAALLSGLLLSMVTFAAGVVGAAFYLATPEQHRPVSSDVSHLWTTVPTTVSPGDGESDRLLTRVEPAVDTGRRPEIAAVGSTPGGRVEVGQEVDETTTGSVGEAPEQADAGYPPAMMEEHAQWCASKYNSFNAEDGTYQPYNGRRRPCVSPFLTAETASLTDGGEAAEEVMSNAERALGEPYGAAEEEMADMTDHVRECSARYRSYRAEDNTYQPFSGGPRRQCR